MPFTPTRWTKVSKNDKTKYWETTHVSLDSGPMSCLSLVGRSIYIDKITLESSLSQQRSVANVHTLWASISTSRSQPWRNFTHVPRAYRRPWFLIVKKWKPPKGPLSGEMENWAIFCSHSETLCISVVSEETYVYQNKQKLSEKVTKGCSSKIFVVSVLKNKN